MTQPTKNNHAVVIGGSMAGLLAARILTNHFNKVTVIERDFLPKEPQLRRGVPQANHVHVLLYRGQQILEQLFPGIKAQIIAAGAPKVDWAAECPWLGLWGWAAQSKSDLITYPCSRYFLEWLVRSRLSSYENLQFLEATKVTQLLTNESRSKVIGVKISSESEHLEQELTADLVVDAGGRNSSLPKWLEQLGYSSVPETVVNPFISYSTRWYEIPEGLQADWKALVIAQKPPHEQRGGVLCSVEGKRWIVTISSIGGEHPPTDEKGFLEFIYSLRTPILYEAIKNAKPITPIHAYRGMKNHWHHYEQLSRFPEGLVAMGDAVCAFNPFYGQGMTVAALSALTLDQELQRFQGNLTKLRKSFPKKLAQVVSIPWMMATGEDLRWSTTQGGKLNWFMLLMQKYMDMVLLLATKRADVHQTFMKVAAMVKPTTAFFQPNILLPVLGQLIRGDVTNKMEANNNKLVSSQSEDLKPQI